LIPEWRTMDSPIKTAATEDHFLVLTESNAYPLPHLFLPRELTNDGNYIISLSQVVRWLATKAEELGVEIYPGFAADEVIYSETGGVCGVATKDAGIAKDGSIKSSFTRGVELHGKQVIFAEGCRGSCATEIIEKFHLQKDRNIQSYALGVKEVWQVPEGVAKPGYIQHTVGWPLQTSVFDKVAGGSFLYHAEPNLVYIGMVVGLDYQNPYLSPYKEFQRFKHHPAVSRHLVGGECIAYGARVLNEGGYHAIPKLTFPGGALVGCAAGFLNSVKIKGSHAAIKSGMLCAESVFEVLTKDNVADVQPGTVEAVSYEPNLKASWVGEELYAIRNSHCAFQYGIGAGMMHTGFSSFITRGREPWTFKTNKPDCDYTLPAQQCKKIDYPKPDGVLSFDLLSNLARSGTSHEADQPAHLRVKPHLSHVPTFSIAEYAGPEQRFCPAGVYEYTEAAPGEQESTRQLVINAQNCIHCKCCSVKTPLQFIKWTVPEGGGGPAYTNM